VKWQWVPLLFAREVLIGFTPIAIDHAASRLLVITDEIRRAWHFARFVLVTSRVTEKRCMSFPIRMQLNYPEPVAHQKSL
jgi:hypothetical protein